MLRWIGYQCTGECDAVVDLVVVCDAGIQFCFQYLHFCNELTKSVTFD